jgi:Mg2+/Co2+ transporter CorB
MKKLEKALTSRTVWTLVILIGTNIVNAFGSYLSTDLMILITSVLGALAVYFKVTPSQKY